MSAPDRNDVVRFACPQCDRRLKAPARMIGKHIDCPNCGTRTKVARRRRKPALEPVSESVFETVKANPTPLGNDSDPFVNATESPAPWESSDTALDSQPTTWTAKPSILAMHPFGVPACVFFGLALVIGGFRVLGNDRIQDAEVKSVVFFVPAAFMFISVAFWLLQCVTTELTISGDRIDFQSGVLSRFSSELRIADVRNIQVSQGIVQRILGAGTIGISSSGQAGIEILMPGLFKPDSIVKMIRSRQE